MGGQALTPSVDQLKKVFHIRAKGILQSRFFFILKKFEIPNRLGATPSLKKQPEIPYEGGVH